MIGNKSDQQAAEQGPRILSEDEFRRFQDLIYDNAPPVARKPPKANAAPDLKDVTRRADASRGVQPLTASLNARLAPDQFSGWVNYGYWLNGKLAGRRKFG